MASEFGTLTEFVESYNCNNSHALVPTELLMVNPDLTDPLIRYVPAVGSTTESLTFENVPVIEVYSEDMTELITVSVTGAAHAGDPETTVWTCPDVPIGSLSGVPLAPP